MNSTLSPAPTGKSAYLLISLVVLALDMVSKWMVEDRLRLFESVEIIPNLLNFTHVQNTGVAFGMFASHGDATGTWILAGLGLAALTFVAYYFYQVPPTDRLLLIALSLVIGGAIGNLIDRIVQGSVTDFVDFYFGTYHWHTFNVADSAITVGIGAMILSTFLAENPEDAADSPDDLDGPGDLDSSEAPHRDGKKSTDSAHV